MPFDPTKPRSRDEVLLQAIVSGDSSAMGDPRDREEEFVKAIADKETLPDYSEASDGDVLQIGADGPEWGAVPNELPAIAAGDAGKVLKVNSGETGVEWGAASGSKKLYRHVCGCSVTISSVTISFSFEIIDSNSEDYNTATKVGTGLYNAGYTANNRAKSICAIGAVSDKMRVIRNVYGASTGVYASWHEFSIDSDGKFSQSNFGASMTVNVSYSITNEL